MKTGKLKDSVKNNVFGYMQQKGKRLEDLWKSNFSKEAIAKTFQGVKNSAIVNKARNVLDPENIKAVAAKTYDEFMLAYNSIDNMKIPKPTKDMSFRERMLYAGMDLGLRFTQHQKGKFDATINVSKNTIGEIKELVTNPLGVPKNLWYAFTHPKETANSIGNSMKDFYDSYERDVLNGNANSKSYWKMNAVGNIGIALIGSKGAGSLTKVGKIPKKPKKSDNENVTNKSWASNKFNELLNTPIWQNAYAIDGLIEPFTISDAFEQATYNLSQIKVLGNGGKGSGNVPKITEIKEGDLGKHIIKGKNGRKELAPNVRYITDDGYKYTTDELGRIVDVEAEELILQKGERNTAMQVAAGREYRLPDDDGGHLIGTQFHGSGDIDNLVAQNKQINRSGG